MTTGQKIAVIISSITVSVVLGGILYLYFNRKSVASKLAAGESVEYKLKEPKAEHHTGSEYTLKLDKDSKSDDGYAIVLYQDGKIRGQYWLIDNYPYYVSNKGKDKEEIIDSKEAKFVKYLLSNV